jgi:hypothetical protein
MLSAIMLSVIMLCGIMPSVIMLNVIMLRVVVLWNNSLLLLEILPYMGQYYKILIAIIYQRSNKI